MNLDPNIDPKTLTYPQRVAFGLGLPAAYNKAVMAFEIRKARAEATNEAEKRVAEATDTITDTVEFVQKAGGGGADVVAIRYVANIVANSARKTLAEVGLQDLPEELYEDIRHLIMEQINLGDASMAKENAMWKQQIEILTANVDHHIQSALSPAGNPMMAQFMQLMNMMMANSMPPTSSAVTQPTLVPEPTTILTPPPATPQPVSLASLAKSTQKRGKKKEADS